MHTEQITVYVSACIAHYGIASNFQSSKSLRLHGCPIKISYILSSINLSYRDFEKFVVAGKKISPLKSSSYTERAAVAQVPFLKLI